MENWVVISLFGGEMRIYIYLDGDGIESLYAQTTDRIELELTRTYSMEGRGEVGLRVGFGNLLKGRQGVSSALGKCTHDSQSPH
jgi:hypothetical protein